MTENVLSRILQTYGIAYVDILAPQKGYRNRSYPVTLPDGRLINLIIYKHEADMAARIRRADQVAEVAAAAGLPARTSLRPVLQLDDGRQSRYARLYNYLPGTTIPWEAYTQDHIKLLGKALGLLHGALAAYSDLRHKQLPAVIDECTDLLERMGKYFQDEGVAQALDRKLGLRSLPSAIFTMDCLLQVCRKLPDQQALHMDFVRGNILFSGNFHDSAGTSDRPERWLSLNGKSAPFISGILDFEKTAYGPPVFDVARSLAFLLVDCKFKQPHKVMKYFVESGYQKRGGQRMDALQLSCLKPLTRFFMLYDFYKFLRHNPYESLPDNEHFLRTRDFLLKDGMIRQTN